jgi:hypothetical protein
MKKSSPLTAVLVSVLLALSVFVVGLALSYVLNVRTLHRLQARAFAINNDRAVLQALVADCAEYSKRNPAMEPLLQSLGQRSRQAAPAGSAKPPAR